MSYQPHQYQKTALEAIATARNSGKDKALLVMASGLGKTLTAGFDLQEFFKTHPVTKVLYLCHNGDILRQAKTKFKELFGENYSYGIYDSISNPNRPTDFLFATFQMMSSHRKSFSRDYFGYIIIDESHHAPARTYQPTIQYFRPQFMLALTATPDRADGADIRDIFGEPIFELGLIEAWNIGLLTRADYRLLLDELQGLSQYLDNSEQRISRAELNRTIFIPKRDEEIVRLIRQYSAEVDDPTTFIFCRSIAHAEHIAQIIGDNAAVVHSKQNPAVNDAILAKFRLGEIKTVVSVGKLNEGIDVPSADVIVFLRDTSSQTIFFQQLGRGLRRAPGKEKVLILDFVANVERLERLYELQQAVMDYRNSEQLLEEAAVSVSDGEQQKPSTRKALAHSLTPVEPLTLNIATPEFRERVVDIQKLVERISFARYTDEQLLEILRSKGSSLGHAPLANEVDADGTMPHSRTYKNRFGNWAQTLHAAGFTPTDQQVCHRYTRQDLIDFLHKYEAEFGETPSMSKINKADGYPDSGTFAKTFGSWNAAMRTAGFQPNQVPYSREELIDFLQQLQSELGHTPTIEELIAADDYPSADPFFSVFGSWGAALKVAGLEPKTERIVCTDEELIAYLHKYQVEFGEVPSSTKMNKAKSYPSSAVYAKRFGSWNAALKAAGLIPNKVRKTYAKEELIRFLQEYAIALGRTPSGQDMSRNARYPHAVTFRRVFGSFEAALAAAGLQSAVARGAATPQTD